MQSFVTTSVDVRKKERPRIFAELEDKAQAYLLITKSERNSDFGTHEPTDLVDFRKIYCTTLFVVDTAENGPSQFFCAPDVA